MWMGVCRLSDYSQARIDLYIPEPPPWDEAYIEQCATRAAEATRNLMSNYATVEEVLQTSEGAIYRHRDLSDTC